MTFTTFSEFEIISRTLYGEARGELATVGEIALDAIASVIWNRWQQNPERYGKSLKEVCLKPYQFSCWNENDPNYFQLIQGDLKEIQAYLACACIAKKWLQCEGIDVTNGANHYYAKWIETPTWAVGKISTIEIGVHRFYRI